MTEHATYLEKADHCTFPLLEKRQIIIVASEMEKLIICINDFLFHLSGLAFVMYGAKHCGYSLNIHFANMLLSV